jgi:hypothetical protein
MWCVLGHIGRRATILAAKRQALQQAQSNQDRGCQEADLIRRRQSTDDEGGRPHDKDRDQEGVFTPDQVAQPPEHQRAERPHQKTRGKGQQGENVARGFVVLAEELGADHRRERTVEVEVVPLEDGAERRGDDDLLLTARHGPNVKVTIRRISCHLTHPSSGPRPGHVRSDALKARWNENRH